MNKRVHEIAKERGIPTKEVLAKLKAAGVEVTAASSSVDEQLASRVLSNGDANGGASAPATKAAAPTTLRRVRIDSGSGGSPSRPRFPVEIGLCSSWRRFSASNPLDP